MKGQCFAITLLRQTRCALSVALLCAAALTFLVSCGSEEPAPTEAPAATPVPGAALQGSSGMSDTSGVMPDRIVFGQSAAFTGPARELGINMRLGIQAAFEEANQGGGVHGRQLSLVSLDDTYEPELAATNTRELIQDEGVFALIGEVGTPTSRSATPVAADANVPFVAPSPARPFCATLTPGTTS